MDKIEIGGAYKEDLGPAFDYQTAFSRNLGWLTPADQLKLSEIHVGLIGVGGVGGQYAEILSRLGIRKFTVYDPDTFSIENTNRQNECKVSNYSKNKAQVIARLIQDINPTAEVEVVARAFSKNDVDDFCSQVDLYLDTLDFFEIDLRLLIFEKMRQLGKTCITAAPLGTGSSCLVFTPTSMSFADYFGLHRTQDAILRSQMFLLGLSPSLQQSCYIQDRGFVDFKKRKAPSMPMGVYACASVVGTTVLKLVLNRGEVLCAPWSVHYDPYLNKIEKRYLWWGYKNPIQRIKLFILKNILKPK
ncbi:MAG: ThiF family adenylyltransferase [Pseudobdellovibrionaceae bacterium]